MEQHQQQRLAGEDAERHAQRGAGREPPAGPGDQREGQVSQPFHAERPERHVDTQARPQPALEQQGAVEQLARVRWLAVLHEVGEGGERQAGASQRIGAPPAQREEAPDRCHAQGREFAGMGLHQHEATQAEEQVDAEVAVGEEMERPTADGFPVENDDPKREEAAQAMQ